MMGVTILKQYNDIGLFSRFKTIPEKRATGRQTDVLP